MKHAKFSLVILVVTAIGFTSCNRDNDSFNDLGNVSEEEALELVQQSLMSEAYGMNIQADDAIVLTGSDTSKELNECGVLNERTMQRSSEVGANVRFTHDIDYRFTLLCEEDVPQAYRINFEGNGTYSSLRLESNDIITYNAVLSNILVPGSPFIYNSSFTREGTQTTKINGNEKDFNSTLTIQSTAVAVDKVSRRILSGSSTFSLNGTTGSGTPFSYSGTITFLGNGTALVEINGTEYQVQL